MRHHPLALACLLLLALTRAGQATSWTATYEFHAAGLRVLEARFLFDVDGPGYRLEVVSRSRGLASLFARSEQVTTVTGLWVGDMPRPQRYRVLGAFRGQRRAVEMDYGPDGQIRLGEVEPSLAAESREAVPAESLAGSLDALSAIARLSRIVAATGRCDVQARLYDARRLTEVTVRTQGNEPVPTEWGAGMQGEALRCELETRLLAGWRTDQDIEQARQPVVTTAWIGRPVAEAPPVPLRLELATRWWGRAHGVLMRMERAGP